MLDFRSLGEQHPAARRELDEAGWEVAGPVAYPTLSVEDTPGAALAAATLDDLVAVLDAFARQVGARGEEGEEPWAGGPAAVVEAAPELASREATAGAPDAWSVPEEIEPGGPVGPGADLAARLRRNRNVFGAERRLSETLVAFHGWLASEGLPEELVLSCADLLRQTLLTGVPLRAIHEFDLRRSRTRSSRSSAGRRTSGSTARIRNTASRPVSWCGRSGGCRARSSGANDSGTASALGPLDHGPVPAKYHIRIQHPKRRTRWRPNFPKSLLLRWHCPRGSALNLRSSCWQVWIGTRISRRHGTKRSGSVSPYSRPALWIPFRLKRCSPRLGRDSRNRPQSAKSSTG